MTDFHSNYNGLVGAQANEWIPTTNQRDLRVVVNPVGLPAGTYMIWYDVADPANLQAQAMFALNMVTFAYWVRTPSALPNTWNAWVNIFGGGGAGVTSFNGRVGVVVPLAGDYTASQITNVPAGNISAVDVQAAINELDSEKVNYFAADAAVAQDILVNVGGGNDYHASGTDLPGRIGALSAGQNAGVTETSNGSVLEAFGDGAIPANSLIRATLGPAGSAQANYSAIIADTTGDVTFGQSGNAQSNLRLTMPAGLPAATGGNGAYAISLDVAATKPFFVNSAGNVCLALTAGPAATGALALDANGMICLL